MASATSIPMPPALPDRSTPEGVANWLNGQINYQEALNEGLRASVKDTPIVTEWLFYAISAATIVAALGFCLLVYLFLPVETVTIMSIPFDPKVYLYLIPLVYLAAGFRTIDTDQIAGATFAGTPVYQFENGLKWVPWGVFSLTKDTTTYVQGEFPGDADRIDWTGEKNDIDPGKVRPLYVLFAENPKGNLATDKQLNAGVAFLVKMRLISELYFYMVRNLSPIDESKREEFLTNVTGGVNVSDRMLEAFRHLRDTGAAFSLEIAGQLSYNEVTTHLALVNRLFMLRLQHEVEKWGIELVEGRYTKINAGHEFNKILEKRGAALAEKDATITTAEAEKQKQILIGEGAKANLTLTGEGAAAAKLADYTAQAEGLEKIAKVMSKKAGRAAQNAQVAKDLGAHGNVTILGAQGFNELLGIANVIQKK
jgi:hypothetical protein